MYNIHTYILYVYYYMYCILLYVVFIIYILYIVVYFVCKESAAVNLACLQGIVGRYINIKYIYI